MAKSIKELYDSNKTRDANVALLQVAKLIKDKIKELEIEKIRIKKSSEWPINKAYLEQDVQTKIQVLKELLEGSK